MAGHRNPNKRSVFGGVFFGGGIARGIFIYLMPGVLPSEPVSSVFCSSWLLFHTVYWFWPSETLQDANYRDPPMTTTAPALPSASIADENSPEDVNKGGLEEREALHPHHSAWLSSHAAAISGCVPRRRLLHGTSGMMGSTTSKRC